MDDSLFEMLMYLFHNYLERKIIHSTFSAANLSRQLEHMELDPEKLTNAADESHDLYLKAPDVESMRYYSDEECEKITLQCRSFILLIEQLSLLLPDEREIIIQQLMDSESNQITMDELRWTILEVLTPKMTLQQAAFLEAVLYPGSKDQRYH